MGERDSVDLIPDPLGYLELLGAERTKIFDFFDRTLPPSETIAVSLNVLIQRDISRADIRGMVVKLPSILSCTAERTNALLTNLEERGIGREQVNGMVVKLPSILSYTAERTNALLEIFEEYYIEFLTKPFRLIFSPRIIRERIEKMKTLGLDVTRFTNKLFYTRKNFEKFEAKYSF